MATVLYIEDAAFVRKKVKKSLEEKGYTVIEADNGASGMDMYFKNKPDIVFMDITMPVMDGIKACELIVQQDPDARIIILSSMGQESMIKEAMDKGAIDFMIKPFDLEKTLFLLEKYLPD